MTPAWIRAAQEQLALGDVADELGLVVRVKGPRRVSIGPCPSCGCDRRHAKRRDKRLALGVRPDGRGWRCFECDLAGDVVDLAALALRGHRYRELADVGRREVRDWISRRLVRVPDEAPKRSDRTLPTAEPVYPPHAEVVAFYRACTEVVADDAVAAYLRSRAIDASEVASRGLARALPESLEVPSWARLSRTPWTTSGHRLVLPLFDFQGVGRSLLARRITGGEPKSIAPRAFDRAGLVLADRTFRQCLRAQRVDPLALVVVEGEIDFATWGTWASRDEASGFDVGVVGLFSGSWTSAFASRIPVGSVVYVRTHTDDAGDAYARKVVQTIGARCEVYRLQSPQTAEGDAA